MERTGPSSKLMANVPGITQLSMAVERDEGVGTEVEVGAAVVVASVVVDVGTSVEVGKAVEAAAAMEEEAAAASAAADRQKHGQFCLEEGERAAHHRKSRWRHERWEFLQPGTAQERGTRRRLPACENASACHRFRSDVEDIPVPRLNELTNDGGDDDRGCGFLDLCSTWMREDRRARKRETNRDRET